MFRPEAVREIVFGDEPEGLRSIIVVVEGEEYDMCEKYSFKRGSNDKPLNSENDNYAPGIMNSEGDPRRTERTGLIGEFALAKVALFVVDLETKDFDETDFIVEGTKIDIKTSTAGRRAREGLIQCQNKKGRIRLKSDVYVIARVENEDRDARTATVRIMGYTSQNVVEQCEERYSGVGPWINRVVPYSILKPVEKFVQWARERQNVV